MKRKILVFIGLILAVWTQAVGKLSVISLLAMVLLGLLLGLLMPGLIESMNTLMSQTRAGCAKTPQKAQITFVSDRDGNPKSYIMDADGENQRRFITTNNPAFEGEPAWSLDDKKIAFTSLRDGNMEIYVMDADGKNQRRLTNNPALDCGPSWFDPAVAHPVSPVGKQTIWDMIKQLFSR
jgi:type II secretory pathway pseudopilin PulG